MKINFAGIIQGQEEADAVIRVIQSEWHGSGNEAKTFEQDFADFIGTKYALTVNSGSSANLLAIKALDIPEGSCVLTSGCGFPATLSPIIHAGYKPVLVDYDIKTHNIDLDQVEKACKTVKVHAIIFAHTMGNPVDMTRLMEIANKYKIKVIEDCCEALGAVWNGKQVGSFGDLATFSFYPSHQLNGMGMGGAIVTNNVEYALKMRSMRNWGKQANAPKFTGDHVTTYNTLVDGIPYDEGYAYETIGYNLLMPDVNVAYLRVQFKRLADFVARRKHNWETLHNALKDLPIGLMPVQDGAVPSYFGFTMITLPDERDKFADYLESTGIRTRPFFAGNITRHDPFRYLLQDLPIADKFMRQALFVGVWPGITDEHLEYIIETIKNYWK
ncbi:MAG: DegT/DnrJ/EryC1/StrS family aminotransferase [Candidatus Berkelbacteria bacterium]|nr:DegT/DnrJ/EryC1/StrS family aminotransferase [Candidatus Berkelbacteria bacterium]